ncbi:hypothetical protein [Heliorestis convoluta]|uniref:Uncharacterized protein n=1 Tax=Heliorestis convoluta TaxID=356322 RepID=A0A5Q2N622_9FIRM|nr:hypothetical protein [Heliorestis convoluta]QGG48802.1 hypothetical protein FTV88_2713 [Heliorestis convoluta]
MNDSSADLTVSVTVGPNELVEKQVFLKPHKPVPGELDILCCVELRKLFPVEIEGYEIVDDKKETLGPPVPILVSAVDFKAIEQKVVKHTFKIRGVPELAQVVDAFPINVKEKIDITGTGQEFRENVKITVTFDLAILFSVFRDGKNKIFTRQIYDLYCLTKFSVPEPEEGTLVAKAKIMANSPVCVLDLA